jgi:hypothetical protein
MTTITEIETTLFRLGFEKQSELTKVAEFIHPDMPEPVYVYRNRKTPAVLIHPKYKARRDALTLIPGVVPTKDVFRHHSNARKFLKRVHKSKKKEKIYYGIQFYFESPSPFETFMLAVLRGQTRCDAFSDIERSSAELAKLTKTERDAIVKSRIGQNPFRDELLKYWKECAAYGCQVTRALRVSHIKPWRMCDNKERLDVYNGLLPTPNLDARFDQSLYIVN